MRLLAKVLLAVAAIAIVSAAAISAAAQPAPSVPEQPAASKKIEVKVTPEMVRHTRIQNVLYFAGIAYSMGVLLLLLATRISARFAGVARKISRKPFLVAIGYFVLFSIATTLLELPLSYYAGFVVPHQFDLTTQTLAAWLGDQAKGFAVNLLIAAPIVALMLLAVARLKRWWVALWLGSIPVMILLVVIAPVFIDPVFNKFEPLKDQVLRQKLLDLASKAGIEGGRVYQVDKSKQTKTMNAYVTGVGPTKRIVMWDTLLAKMSHDEVLAVMAHEMGHYKLNHLWKGLAAGILISLGVCFAGQKMYDLGIARYGTRWGVTAPGDPAALPWLLVIVSATMFLLSPVTNGMSRYMEHESDIYSLEVTHLNEPMATAFVKLSEDSKMLPQPHPFIEFWRYSHPPIAKRIDFALNYKPWEKGQPNALWKP